MQIMEANRTIALQNGVLLSGDNDWVDAILHTSDTFYNCNVRLKGDWVDHLQGDKWSFRIKLGSDDAINGMRVFSVQDPITRDHLSEYVYHQWLAAEDILTTRYDFIPFTLNKGKTYTYAVEEHFDINLIESQHRRAGPILRFSEEFLWDLRVQDSAAFKSGGMYENNIDVFAITDILSFSDKGLGKDVELTKQYEVARTLMQQYRAGKVALADIFDMDKMAKYFAIVDINQAYHSLIWHNMRFYFNPITQKLEPIGFDGFTEYGVYDNIKRPFIGYSASYQYRQKIEDDALTDRFFNDFEFSNTYAKYLHKFADTNYINAFFDSIGESLTEKGNLIRKDYPEYQYNKKHIYDRTLAIEINLKPQGDYTLRAFADMAAPAKIGIINHVAVPVSVLGMSIRPDTIMYYLDKPINLPAWNEYKAPPFAAVKKIGESQYLFYKVAGTDSLVSVKISPWEDDLVQTPEQRLFNTTISSNELYVIKNNEIFFKPGLHVVTKPIIFPAGYNIHISPGTQLDLRNGAMFVSRSPLSVIGTESSPIKIFSSDSTSMGFTVLQAASASAFQYVIFDHLSALDHEGWKLMGAVNFYESTVSLEHCRFTHSQCEDALNIMRSNFSIDYSYFANTYGDAFDSDFSTGTVKNTYLTHTGNDALDFSGSFIEVKRCELVHLGDKGMSCGEDSKITISDCSIKDARIGVAAKDLSRVEVQNLQISDSGIGYLAFVKKQAFGKSSIQVTGGTLTNVKQTTSVLDGCEIIMQ